MSECHSKGVGTFGEGPKCCGVHGSKRAVKARHKKKKKMCGEPYNFFSEEMSIVHKIFEITLSVN